MPSMQIVHGRGAYTRRPRAIRNPATGQWLARVVRAGEPPEWTPERTGAWLGLAAAALRQIDVLRELGVEAEME